MSTSIKKARDFVASLCEQLRISESITYRALLAVSELATNALQHAPESRAMVVIVFVCDRGLVAEVEDRSDVPPKIRGMAAPESERGRGLAILNEVVELLGWNYIADGGKVVYAVLGGDIAA